MANDSEAVVMKGVLEEYELDVTNDETAKRSWDSRSEVLKSGIMTITPVVRGVYGREGSETLGCTNRLASSVPCTGIDFYYSALS